MGVGEVGLGVGAVLATLHVSANIEIQVQVC